MPTASVLVGCLYVCVCVCEGLLYTPFVLRWDLCFDQVRIAMFFMSNLKTFSKYATPTPSLPPASTVAVVFSSSLVVALGTLEVCCRTFNLLLLRLVVLVRLPLCSLALSLLLLFLLLLGNCFVCILWSFLMCQCMCVYVLWCARKYLVLINFYKYSL